MKENLTPLFDLLISIFLKSFQIGKNTCEATRISLYKASKLQEHMGPWN